MNFHLSKHQQYFACISLDKVKLTVPIMSTSFPNTSIVSTPLCATPEKELEKIYDSVFMMDVV